MVVNLEKHALILLVSATNRTAKVLRRMLTEKIVTACPDNWTVSGALSVLMSQQNHDDNKWALKERLRFVR